MLGLFLAVMVGLSVSAVVRIITILAAGECLADRVPRIIRTLPFFTPHARQFHDAKYLVGVIGPEHNEVGESEIGFALRGVVPVDHSPRMNAWNFGPVPLALASLWR